MEPIFQIIHTSNQQNQIENCTLYVIMSTNTNPQLQFFIKLTQIIGRAFADLQQLLTSELRRQQSDIQIRSIIVQTQSNQQAINYLPESLPPSSLQSNPVEQNEKKQSSEQEENNKKDIIQRQQGKNKKKKIKIHKIRKQKKNNYQVKQKKKRKKKLTNKVKEQGKPCPPLNAFMLFLQEKKYDIMSKRPELTPSQVSIYASTIWNGFNESEKQHYLQIYRKNHEIYLQKLKIFRNQKIPVIRMQKNEQDSKEYQNQGHIMSHLRSNMRTRIKRRKFTRNEVICIESQEQNQNQPSQNCN